jgi:hypothetical protein
MGTLSGGVISRGTTGVDVTYDGAGNRATATYGYDNHGEAYTYTADGYLEDTYISGVRRSSRTADAMGRVTQYTEYGSNGVTASLSRSATFDNDNRVTGDTTDTIAGSTTTRAVQTYDYRAWNGSSYSGAAQGVVAHVRADNFTVGQNNHVYTDTNTYYTYWDEAKQSSIRIGASNPNNPNSGQWAPGMSSLTYDVNGHITTLVDQTAQGGATTVKYRNDAYGQVLVREESKNGIIGPRQLYYYFAGMRIGDVGNNGPSPSLVDYAQQLATRGAAQPTGLYRNGRPVASADFDENYQPINAGYPGVAASSYTVQGGDTLYSIARALWGDQAMWFLIAEANGITAATQLVPGQRLIIPNKVTNFHNASGTFRVYDPGEAIGDTMPTLPNEPAPPPAVAKKKGCGIFGQILGFIISIAVSFLLPGVGQVVGKVIGKAIGGAIGGAIGTAAGFGIQAGLVSAVSQGINVAVGIQDNFSWSNVGISALGGFLFGPGALPVKGSSIGTIAKNIAVGAATNAAVQGIAIATGLQDEFSWGSVAAAGVSGGLGGAVNTNSRGGQLAKSVAQGLARATARSLVDGTDFGDNLIAELPGVIATTIGSFAADQVTKSRSPKLDYGDVMSDDQVVGVGNETQTIGSEDGTSRQPTIGVGDRRAVGSVSIPDEAGEEIVVVADRHMHDLIQSMTGYQWSAYFGRMGQRLDHYEAHQVLGDLTSARLVNTVLTPHRSSISFGTIGRGTMHLGGEFINGAFDTLRGVAYLLSDTIAPGSPTAIGRWSARTDAVTSGRFVTSPIQEYVNALDSLFDDDDPSKFVRMAGGGIVTGGGGRVLGGLGKAGAAETAVLSTSKFVPNPYGKLGGIEHRALVADITADIRFRGLTPPS